MKCFHVEVVEMVQVLPQGLLLQPPARKEFPAQLCAADAQGASVAVPWECSLECQVHDQAERVQWLVFLIKWLV